MGGFVGSMLNPLENPLLFIKGLDYFFKPQTAAKGKAIGSAPTKKLFKYTRKFGWERHDDSSMTWASCETFHR